MEINSPEKSVDAGVGDAEVTPTTFNEQSVPLESINDTGIEEVNKASIEEMAFIPGNSYDFDCDIEGQEILAGDKFSKVGKRKKKQCEATDLGRYKNIEYSSSLEKTKDFKKPKDNGPVDFNDTNIGPMVGDFVFSVEPKDGGMSEKMGDLEGLVCNVETSNPFVILERQDQVMTEGEQAQNNSHDEDNIVEPEVDKTVRLGTLLGADLQDHRSLVQATISGEGVQRGVQ